MSVAQDFIEKKENIERYYENTVIPALQAIEKNRKKYLMRFGVICIFTLIWLVVLFINFNIEAIGINIDVAGVVSCFLILFICWPMFGYYRKSKESLLPVIAGYFGEFSYAYQKNVSETLLNKSLIMKKYDRFDTDDCFAGLYDSCRVSIIEYTLRKLKFDNSSDSKRETYVKNGHGIIFRAEMNKNFTGQTIVVKDKGIFNKFDRYKNMQRVGLESPEFEKAFEVYSDNQIEARYILTTVMLEYMLELKKIFPKIEFSFFESQVFINIEIKENLFECSSFFTSVINKKRIDKNLYQLYLLFSVINILRLNQKSIF